MIKLIALACSHNRREKTLKSIESLGNAFNYMGVQLQIVLVDDCSSDGTAASVKERFPEVQVLPGSGNLFWAGGMRFGYEQIKDKQYDYLLVFNDDVVFLEDGCVNAIVQMLTDVKTLNEKIIFVGACSDILGDTVTYGGVNFDSKIHPLRFSKPYPKNGLKPVDSFNMNFAIIPKHVLVSNGFLSDYFVHGGADIEYGLRVKKNGVKILLLDKFVGICPGNTEEGTSLEEGIGYFERLKRLCSVKEQPPKQRLIYYKNHGGPLWPIYFVLPYVRAILSF